MNENNMPTRRNGWSSFELAYLENNYKEVRTERIMEVLNRSRNSVWQKVHELKIAKLKSA